MVAVPPDNDVDVFAHDLGFIAIVDEDGEVEGWNVTVGGGMGMTHGEPATYPRTADVHGLLPARAGGGRGREGGAGAARLRRPQQPQARAAQVHRSRTAGVAWFRAEVERRLGYPLEDPRPIRFTHTGDRYGWTEDRQGDWHFTLFVENGRVQDTPERPMRTGLRKIAEVHKGEFRLTAEPEPDHRQA